MHRFRFPIGSTLVLVSILGVVLSTSLAIAQPRPGIGEPLGSLYVSGSPDSYDGFIEAIPFEPFTFYVLTEIDFADIGRGDLRDEVGLQAWEAMMSVPPSVTVTSVEVFPFSALTVLIFPEFLVGLSDNFLAWPSPYMLVRLQGIIIASPAPTDLLVDLGAVTPTSFPETPAPGWNEGEITGECTTPDGALPVKCLRLFASVRGMWINCVEDCTVTVEQPSWGTLKSNFGR